MWVTGSRKYRAGARLAIGAETVRAQRRAWVSGSRKQPAGGVVTTVVSVARVGVRTAVFGPLAILLRPPLGTRISNASPIAASVIRPAANRPIRSRCRGMYCGVYMTCSSGHRPPPADVLAEAFAQAEIARSRDEHHHPVALALLRSAMNAPGHLFTHGMSRVRGL